MKSRHSLNQNQQAKLNNHTDELITSLKSEIQFLRQELLSKDSIIKLLINDCNKSMDTKSKELFNYIPNPVGKISDGNTFKCFNPLTNDTRKRENFVDEIKTSEKVCNIKSGFKLPSRCDTLKDDNKYIDGRKKRKQRSTIIIGDSILKDIEQRKMREAMGTSEKVYIKSFSGVDTEDNGTLRETHNEI